MVTGFSSICIISQLDFQYEKKEYYLHVNYYCICGYNQGANEQYRYFFEGDNIINLGVGLGGTYDYGGNMSSGFSQTPSYLVTYENATIDPGGVLAVGFGGYLSYLSSKNSWTDGYSYTDKYSFEFIMARAALHYKIRFSAKIDPYLGVMAGYPIAQHQLETADPNYMYKWDIAAYTAYSAEPANSGMFQFGGYLGARYYFTDRFGIWAELVIMNNAYNFIALGINFKL